MDLIFHADDFGITPEQSEHILRCSDICGGTGALNSLSVLVNSPHFPTCADLLDEHLDSLRVGLHVNIVEGRCCADPATIPLLVDGNGVFKHSFAELLFAPRGEMRCAYRSQLAAEIGAQLDAYLARFPQMRGCLRLDSHQHFHLIPLVFAALLNALDARGCTLEYLRVPAEPLAPFALTPAVWTRIPPINLIKQWLLDYLWRIDRKIWEASALAPYEQLSAIFCGINFSGHMTVDRVTEVFPAFVEYAQTRNMALELLFHPGGYRDSADALNPALDGFVAFYTSPLRAAEGETLRALAIPGAR